MTILIGDLSFRSKSAAAAAIRAVLYRYPIGATVRSDDVDFLAAVLRRHPEQAQKIGCGVASFQVQQNLGSRGFWLTRTDGTRTDWSFLSCLTPPTPAQEVKAAFRTEIREEIRFSKRVAFDLCAEWPCPITGERLTFENAHVDHEIPFDTLLDRFLNSRGLVLGDVRLEATVDGSTDTRLADRALAAAWLDFHREHASLRIVSRLANLSILKRQPCVH